MNPKKIANTQHPIHEFLVSRYSPYGFSDQQVSEPDLLSLLEAARWAPSSYNEQPWSYIVGVKSEKDQFERVLSCLVEGNQAWAKTVSVLMIGCTSLNFSKNGKPNAAAEHDLGLAAANLSFEATARGLAVHQMIGILPDKVREVFHVPEGVAPLTGIAIGYAADLEDIPEPLKARDSALRKRKEINEFVFGDSWGKASKIFS